MHEKSRRPLLEPTLRGVHHLALCTDDMKATIDFYVDVLGMPLVHAMKVPPGLGIGPGNRGNPPYERVRHYFRWPAADVGWLFDRFPAAMAVAMKWPRHRTPKIDGEEEMNAPSTGESGANLPQNPSA